MAEPLTFDYRPRLDCLVPRGIAVSGFFLLVNLNKAMLTRAGQTVYDFRGPVPEWFL